MIKISHFIRDCRTLAVFQQNRPIILNEISQKLDAMARKMLPPNDIHICECGKSLDWFMVPADSRSYMMIANCECGNVYQRTPLEDE